MALANGTEYSWVNVKMALAGIPVFGVDNIKYKKKQEKTNNYGIGPVPVSRSYGIAEFEASITLHASEVEALTNVAPNRDLTQIPPFEIIVTMIAPGRTPVVHKLRGVEFMENGRDMKIGDEKIGVELDLILYDIEY